MVRRNTDIAEDDPRHGTYNAYNNLGCRCQPCKTANTAEMQRNRERRLKEIGPDDPRHGKVSFYFNYGCRCDACRAANTAYAAARKARLKGALV